MSIFVPKTPGGYTVFCDDVRVENTGKMIYIGVYAGQMVLHGDLPALIPSFAAAVTYSERPGESTEPVTIKMFLPEKEEPITAVAVDTTALRSNFNPDIDPDKEDQIQTMVVLLRVSPMPIEYEGRVKVRAYRGEDEIRLGTLAVKTAATMQSALPGIDTSTGEQKPSDQDRGEKHPDWGRF